MKTRSEKNRNRSGFTVLEMTVALMLAMGVAGVGLAMLTQHASFINMMRQFTFLREEAPQINSIVSRITGQAVSYRVHTTKADAFNNTSATTTGGTALRLVFRNPNGQLDQSAIVFENVGGVDQLNFYNFDGGWPAEASWTITGEASNVTFANDTGVLLITLTGPNAEEITYVGNSE